MGWQSYLHMPVQLAGIGNSGLSPGGANCQLTCCLSWQALSCQ